MFASESEHAKGLFKINFGHNHFLCEPIYKIFVALFRTFGLQKIDMVIFFLWCFIKVRFLKMQFLKDGVQTVGKVALHLKFTAVDLPTLWTNRLQQQRYN